MDQGTDILRFYRGGRDSAGRTRADILAWDNDRLELVHDYIQWLFPLPERSAFNPAAPILTDADIATFRADATLRGALLASFRRLLAFYGLRLDGTEVARAADFPQRATNWLTQGNHNLLRITRILRSLHLLGETDAARAFLAALEALYAQDAGATIGARTLRFWRNAIGP